MFLAKPNLVDLQELNFKDKGSIGRDKTGEASGSISIVTSGGDLGNLTERDLGDTFIPTSDNLANTDSALERIGAVAGGIKLGAVQKGTNVVDGDTVSLLGVVSTIASLDCLYSNTHVVFEYGI